MYTNTITQTQIYKFTNKNTNEETQPALATPSLPATDLYLTAGECLRNGDPNRLLYYYYRRLLSRGTSWHLILWLLITKLSSAPLPRQAPVHIPAADRYLNDCATVFLFSCSGKTRTHTSVLSTTRPGALCRVGKDMRQKYKEIYNIFIYILLYIFYIILYYVDT